MKIPVFFIALFSAMRVFAADGLVTVDVGGYTNILRSMIVLNDDKILAGGYTSGVTGTKSVLVKLNADGTPDLSFGTDGIQLIDILGGQQITALAQRADGKIVCADWTMYFGIYSIELFVVDETGTIDPVFGTDGFAVFNIPGGDETVQDMVLQPDGKIIITGSFASAGITKMMVARFNEDGSPDNTFDIDGYTLIDYGTTVNFPNEIVLQADGKIVVAGVTNIDVYYDFAVVRLHVNGSPDNSFGGDGKISLDILDSDNAEGLAITPDGKIVVIGQSTHNEPGGGAKQSATFARFNSDGSLDSEFGDSGIKKARYNTGNYASVYHGAMQSDGKLIAVGSDGPTTNFAIARVLANGKKRDVSFSDNGVYIAPDFFEPASSDWCWNLGFQSDGRIIMAGNANTYDQLAFLRMNTDGTLDETFGTVLFKDDANQKTTTQTNGSYNIYFTGNAIAIEISGAEAGLYNGAVYDISGREIISEFALAIHEGNNSAEIPARELPSGIYFVSIHSGRQMFTKRIFVI